MNNQVPNTDPSLSDERPKWIYTPSPEITPLVPANKAALILDLRSENAALIAALKMQTENHAISRYRAEEYSKLYHEAEKLLETSFHALRSYQYGNFAAELAEDVANRIGKFLNPEAANEAK